MKKSKLTLDQAKERFASTGQCFHEEAHEIKAKIPKTKIVQIMCGACNKVKKECYT